MAVGGSDGEVGPKAASVQILHPACLVLTKHAEVSTGIEQWNAAQRKRNHGRGPRMRRPSGRGFQGYEISEMKASEHDIRRLHGSFARHPHLDVLAGLDGEPLLHPRARAAVGACVLRAHEFSPHVALGEHRHGSVRHLLGKAEAAGKYLVVCVCCTDIHFDRFASAG